MISLIIWLVRPFLIPDYIYVVQYSDEYVLLSIRANIETIFFIHSCISEICKKSEAIVKDVIKVCGIPFFLDILNSHHEETVNASSYVIQASILHLIAQHVYLFSVKQLQNYWSDSINYTRDLKSDHLKSTNIWNVDFLKVWFQMVHFLKGWALTTAIAIVPTIQKPDQFKIRTFLSEFQMVFDKMAICPDFKWLDFQISYKVNVPWTLYSQ